MMFYVRARWKDNMITMVKFLIGLNPLDLLIFISWVVGVVILILMVLGILNESMCPFVMSLFSLPAASWSRSAYERMKG